jgi:dTDP-4-dehydrorhamnose 3,5-epimerase
MGLIKLIETGLPGLLIVEPKVFSDDRGYFFESYNHNDFVKENLDFNPVQDNESSSAYGVIRGLHFQNNPHAQSKLVRVIEGEIFDVALDLRKGSPTYGKWYGVQLNSANKLQFYIPKGFAHGFSVLSEKAVVIYKCDDYYSPGDENGINPFDPALNIDWMVENGKEILSPKDKKNPYLADLKNNFTY